MDRLQATQDGGVPPAAAAVSSSGAGPRDSPAVQAALERALNEQQRAADMAHLADRRLQELQAHDLAAQVLTHATTS